MCFATQTTLRAQYIEPRLWTDLGQNWIAQACGDGCCDVWFAKDYTLNEAPDRAILHISTTGWVEIFVNGRNVDTALLSPYATNIDDEPLAASYDVTLFMRQGSNTLAIDYSPRSTHCSGCALCSIGSFHSAAAPSDSTTVTVRHNDHTGQIAASLQLTYSDGRDLCFSTDDNWLCRTGRRRLTHDGGELIDGREPEFRQGCNDGAIALWAPACEQGFAVKKIGSTTASSKQSLCLDRVCVPTYQTYSDDAYVYSLREPIFGYMRLTLRDCKRGDHVSVGKLHYICRGEPDEQAIGKFAPQTLYHVDVSGPDSFTRDNIFMIEGLSIVAK